MNINFPAQSDCELVAAALRDPHSFTLIVKKYQAPLQRYIIRLGCADTRDVEDVLQEVFLKCYTHLNDYDSDLKFSSWLYRIAHNETMSLFRRKQVRPISMATEEELKLFENIPEETDFLDDLTRKSDAKAIHDALGRMNKKYRSVIILRFFEEKNYAEISDILHIPEGTVATYINRGKKSLNEILSPKRISYKRQ